MADFDHKITVTAARIINGYSFKVGDVVEWGGPANNSYCFYLTRGKTLNRLRDVNKMCDGVTILEILSAREANKAKAKTILNRK